MKIHLHQTMQEYLYIHMSVNKMYVNVNDAKFAMISISVLSD